MPKRRKLSPARVVGSRVSATEAAKNFGRLVDRVREEHATYIVERGGKPVAQIGPAGGQSFSMADFKALVRSLPSGGSEYLEAVEGAAARHNRPRVRRNPWGR
jgi:antitoxin (DNA-binding transcriptional repressor) of toxin-antitoxin stability system